MKSIKIKGSQSALVAFREEIINNGFEHSVDFGELRSQASDPVGRPKQGMEPMTYFLIVFAAHLSAAATRDLVVKLKGIAKKYRIQLIEVDQESRSAENEE